MDQGWETDSSAEYVVIHVKQKIPAWHPILSICLTNNLILKHCNKDFKIKIHYRIAMMNNTFILQVYVVTQYLKISSIRKLIENNNVIYIWSL